MPPVLARKLPEGGAWRLREFSSMSNTSSYEEERPSPYSDGSDRALARGATETRAGRARRAAPSARPRNALVA